MRSGQATTRQDEFFQRREGGVEGFDVGLDFLDVRVGHHGVAGHGQFTAQVEQVVLHTEQAVRDVGRQAGRGQQQAHTTVEFVHGADRFDAGGILVHAAAIA